MGLSLEQSICFFLQWLATLQTLSLPIEQNSYGPNGYSENLIILIIFLISTAAATGNSNGNWQAFLFFSILFKYLIHPRAEVGVSEPSRSGPRLGVSVFIGELSVDWFPGVEVEVDDGKHMSECAHGPGQANR